MAKPYREGAGWAFRSRVEGEDIYQAGFKTEAVARRAMASLIEELRAGTAESGHGPHRTSLGVAFSDYARERLPYLKGAKQDVKRINRYLLALKLPRAVLEPVELVKDGKRVYFRVTFEAQENQIANSLAAHRAQQAAESAASDKERRRLARMMVADVTTHHIQALINALVDEGKLASTVHNERSELRRLFKHARAVWKWKIVGANPAGVDLDMPTLDDARDRVLSNQEWMRVAKELASYGNPYVAPLACLMLETAMRSCESLLTLRWWHIDWERRVIALPDAKTGGREVPLGPGAIQVLQQLQQMQPNAAPGDKVFPTTYEAVKKAWRTACERANVFDMRLYDLRHTSATRFALEFKGNMPVLKMITGHKTTKMVDRYVNLKASDVSSLMHNEELDPKHAAAGYKMSVLGALEATARPQIVSKKEASVEAGPPATLMAAEPEKSNVIPVNFKRRAA